MISKKAIFLMASYSLCVIAHNNANPQHSIVKVSNHGSQYAIAQQTVIIPPRTKATITTDLESLKPHDNSQISLLKAIIADDAEAIAAAVHAGANINQEIAGHKPLAIAAIQYKDNAFKVLLDLGADFNIMCQGEKLVHFCIRTYIIYASNCNNNCNSDTNQRNQNPAVLLLKKDADISGWPHNEDIILHAINSDNIELISELLKRGYNLSTIKHPTMEILVKHPSILKLFLTLGLDPNQEIEHAINLQEPWSPLTIAINQGSYESVRLLLEFGANPNFATPKMPLYYAIEHTINTGNTEILNLLTTHSSKL